jgi:hypothetical protein
VPRSQVPRLALETFHEVQPFLPRSSFGEISNEAK